MEENGTNTEVLLKWQELLDISVRDFLKELNCTLQLEIKFVPNDHYINVEKNVSYESITMF